jgi:hypothetical protein
MLIKHYRSSNEEIRKIPPIKTQLEDILPGVRHDGQSTFRHILAGAQVPVILELVRQPTNYSF